MTQTHSVFDASGGFPASQLFFSRTSNVGFHAHTCQSLVQFQHFKFNRLSFFVVASFVSF